MLRRILVPAPGADVPDGVLAVAARLAAATDARLDLLGLRARRAAPFGLRGRDAGLPSLGALAPLADRADAFALHVGGRPLHVRWSVEDGDPCAAILAVADATDLVVMAAGDRARAFDGLAERVARRAAAPVLAVPPAWLPAGPWRGRPWPPAPAHPDDRPLRILVALDPDGPPEPAVGAAAGLARLVGGELLLATVVEPLPIALRARSPGVARACLADELARAERLLGRAARAAGPAARVADRRVTVGDPAAALARVAEQLGADLIVVLPRPGVGVVRLLSRGVSVELARRAGVPVLFARPLARVADPARVAPREAEPAPLRVPAAV